MIPWVQHGISVSLPHIAMTTSAFPQKLLAGYRQFRQEVFPLWQDHFHLLVESQKPDVLFITCSDSRVVPPLIFQTEPGDMFLCRNAGNVVPPAGERAGGVSATIEYAVKVLHVRHIVICGHSDCGAVRAAMEPQRTRELPLVQPWLQFIERAQSVAGELVPASGPERDLAVRKSVSANIAGQLANLRTQTAVAEALAAGKLTVHGWYYDILTGTIQAFVPEERRFVPLDSALPDAADPAGSRPAALPAYGPPTR